MSEAILITGGCGFIGSHITDRLFADGHAVVVVDDLSTGDKANLTGGAVFRQGSVADRAFLEGVFDEFTISAVIHEATHINTSVLTEEPALDVSTNIAGTINLIELALACGSEKFVFASSSAVYGNPENPPVAEGGPERPVYSYGIAKQCAERYVRFYAVHHGLDAHIVRYANVYGPRQPVYGEVGVIAIFTRNVLGSEPLSVIGDGSQERDYLFVDDAVEATVRLLGHPGGETFNVASGEGTSVIQVVDAFEKACGRPLERASKQERVGELGSFYLDTSKISQALDWEPEIDLVEGVKKTLDYYRDAL